MPLHFLLWPLWWPCCGDKAPQASSVCRTGLVSYMRSLLSLQQQRKISKIIIQKPDFKKTSKQKKRTGNNLATLSLAQTRKCSFFLLALKYFTSFDKGNSKKHNWDFSANHRHPKKTNNPPSLRRKKKGILTRICMGMLCVFSAESRFWCKSKLKILSPPRSLNCSEVCSKPMTCQ